MWQEQCSEQWEFMRGFSALGRLQMRSTMQYQCRRQAPGEYRFALIRQQDAGSTQQDSALIRGIQGWQARQLIQYLFENAVPFENWQDILMELKEKL